MSQNGHKPWLLGPGVHPGDASKDDSAKLIALFEQAFAHEFWQALFPPDQIGERICWRSDELHAAVARGGPDDENYWGSEQAAA